MRPIVMIADGALSAGTGGSPVGMNADLLIWWLSSALPTGGYAYSQGLEQAAAEGWVSGPAGLCDWLADGLMSGALRHDLILIGLAYDATAARDGAALGEIAELGRALQPTAERRMEAELQGAAFADAMTAWEPPTLPPLPAGALTATPPILPVAVGIAAARHLLPRDDSRLGFAAAALANAIGAGIRLSLIGQRDGQHILATLRPLLQHTVAATKTAGIADLGVACWLADIASARHETLDGRLFRS